MTKNFYTILQNVCTIAHEEQPFSFGSTQEPYPEIKKYIQDINEEICAGHKWKFREKTGTISLVANTASYLLPTGAEAKYIIESSVRINDETCPLNFISHQNYEVLKQGSVTGKPYCYTVFGNNVVFYPTPDAAYTISLKFFTSLFATNSTGLVYQSNLEEETDLSIIPERYTKTLEWGAYALFRQNFKPDDKFAAAFKKYQDYLKDMKKDNGYGGDAKTIIKTGIGVSGFFNDYAGSKHRLDNYYG